MTNVPKFLIIGYGRHGKDTMAEYLRDQYGYKFMSSSLYVAKQAIWPHWGCAVYSSFDEMFEDRHKHRKLWKQMISAYSTPNKMRTCQEMLELGYDMYVGLRERSELEAIKKHRIFDAIIWVDRSKHLPPESSDSMDLNVKDADYLVDNNGTIKELEIGIERFMEDTYGLRPLTQE